MPAPKGKGKTRTVCKRGCKFKTIQAAVNKSKKGDTVRVKNGTYREAVKITGAKKSYLKLIGNPKNPGKVVLEGAGDKQNGVFVNGADEVTVRGFKAQNYTANGFFFVNVVGYTARDLIAAKTGVYGVYAFNSKGGTMRDSEAYYNNDAGFYIGQTPAQVKPIRSIVDNIDSWGNPLGWSGTNMRYVTITNSRFYNNAAGIVPERAGLGEVPARGGQHHPRQRDLLEQLQLPQGRAVQDPRGGHGRARARSAPASCCSAAGATSSSTTRSTATGRIGVAAIEGILLAGEPAGHGARRQRGARQRVRARRHRPQRARARLRRQRHRTTASAATPASR